jgi:RNA polymerase sigma factor (sigma-70 family)
LSLSSKSALSLYLAHRGALLNYANGIIGDRAQAEDVVQEAYLRFADAAARRLYDEPVSYLYRIVHNLSFDGMRRLSLEARHVKRGVEQAAAEIPEEKPSPEAESIARQELGRVMAAVADLPERTRIAFEMHRLGGFKLRQIAEHLGISVSMAQLLVVEAVKRCQSSLSSSSES